MKKMSQRTKWILIGVAGTAVLGWSVMNTLQATQPVEEPKTAKVRATDIVLSVDGSGTLEMISLPLGFEISGEIATVLPSGTSVKQGEMIAALVNDKEELALAKASLSMASLTSPAAYSELILEKMLLEDDRELAIAVYDQATNGPDIAYYAEQVSLTEARYWDAVAVIRTVRRIPTSMKVAIERALEDWENAKLDLEWAINFVPNQTDTLLTSAQLSQTESAIQDADIAAAVIQGVLDPNLNSGASLGTGAIADSWFALREADLNLARSTIYAPFDGLVANVVVASGEKASAFQTIVQLVDPSSVTANFTVEEVDLFALNIGDPISVSLAAYPSVTLVGEVSWIGTKVNADGSVDVKGSVTIPEGIRIFSGMSVEVTVETDKAENAPALISSAIFTDPQGKTFVKKIGPLGNEETVYVTIGISDLANTQIISGLEPGDVVSLSAPKEQE